MEKHQKKCQPGIRKSPVEKGSTHCKQDPNETGPENHWNVLGEGGEIPTAVGMGGRENNKVDCGQHHRCCQVINEGWESFGHRKNLSHRGIEPGIIRNTEG